MDFLKISYCLEICVIRYIQQAYLEKCIIELHSTVTALINTMNMLESQAFSILFSYSVPTL